MVLLPAADNDGWTGTDPFIKDQQPKRGSKEVLEV